MDGRFGRENAKKKPNVNADAKEKASAKTRARAKELAGKACAVLLSIMVMAAFTGAVQVGKAYAGDKSIRVVFGTYDAEGVSSFDTERTFTLDETDEGHACTIDAALLEGENPKCSLYRIVDGLLYVETGYTFDKETGTLVLPASMDTSNLTFDYLVAGEGRVDEGISASGSNQENQEDGHAENAGALRAQSLNADGLGAVTLDADDPGATTLDADDPGAAILNTAASDSAVLNTAASDSAILNTAASGATIPSTVYYKHGHALFYGKPGEGHATMSFHVVTPDGDTLTAYCINPPKGCASEQDLHTTPIAGGTVSIHDPDKLAMVLYFGPGGAGYDSSMWPAMPDEYFGDSADTAKERHYCCTHVLATLAAFNGEVNAYQDCSSEFKSWFKSKILGDYYDEMERRWNATSAQLRELYRDSCFLLDPVNLDGAGSNAQEIAVASPKLPAGMLELVKVSGNAGITDGNACYSLAGARYGVFETRAKAQGRSSRDALQVASTDLNGKASFPDALAVGTYYVSELAPSAGYSLDDQVYEAEIKQGKTTKVNGSSGVREIPLEAPIGIMLAKQDATTGSAVAQGNATLAGAEFTVRYYAGHYDESTLPGGATRSWVMKTDRDGRVDFSNAPAYKVSGDDFYRNGDGQFSLPLGTVSIVETKAPAGYLLDNGSGSTKTYVFQIVQDDSAPSGAKVKPINYSGSVTESNAPIVPDRVIRGDYRLVKEASIDIREDAPQDQKRVLVKGVQFQIVNDSDNQVVSPATGSAVARGEVVCTITTDDNGLASTRAGASANGWSIPSGWGGALAYGTYIVREVIPESVQNTFLERYGTKLTPAADWKISISSQGQLDPAPLVNNGIPQSPLKVVKVDAETGERIPLPASFQLCDHAGALVTYTAHYPEESTIDTFTSNERGEVTLPMVLKGGTYTLREVQAPEGYTISDDEITFTVDEYRSWDDPIEVTFEDKPIKGVIELEKHDAGNSDVLAGAQYVVTAAADIVTPDGTVRKPAGETVAVMVTDGDGKATTPELYLGTYTVYESKAPDGFALDTEEHTVSIVSEGQDVPLVTTHADMTDNPTTLRIAKTDSRTGEPLAGAVFRIWKDAEKAAGESQETASEWEVTTGEDGTAELSHLAHGSYHILEIKVPTGYHVPEGAGQMDFEVDDQGFVGTGKLGFSDTFTISIENERNEIGTTATVDGAKTASASGMVTLVDAIAYKGCVPGAEYVATGVLHRAVTDEEGNRVDGGELVDAGGNPVTATSTFVPESDSGVAEVVFEFDASALAGASVVAFEKVYCAGELFAEHENIQDSDQTVTFKPNIATTLVDERTECHTGRVDEKVTLVDTVEYEGLMPGTQYTVRGTLMDKETAMPIERPDGSAVTAEASFAPDAPNGAVVLEFKFDSSGFAGGAAVAFERLYAAGAEVAAHEDIEDESQTVHFPAVMTQASDGEDEDSFVEPDGNARIVDTVAYTGLTPGRTYLVEGELHATKRGDDGTRVDDGVLKDVDGKAITASETFVPEKPDGTVKVTFEFDASELAETSSVVYEVLKQECATQAKGKKNKKNKKGKKYEFVEVARHADANNKDQSIELRKPTPTEAVITQVKKLMPKAGDSAWIPATVMLAAISILSALAAVIAFKLKRLG